MKYEDGRQIETIAKEMRRYAVEYPITDYDAFAQAVKAAALAQDGKVDKMQHNPDVTRTSGSRLPNPLVPYTRFVAYETASLQICYMHITDFKINKPLRQLNIVENWGLPLNLVITKTGIERLLEQFLDPVKEVKFQSTPSHVLLLLQPLDTDQHNANYHKVEKS